MQKEGLNTVDTIKRLYRNESNKMLGGVCSGLADYFGLDVSLVRVGLVLLAFATHLGPLAGLYLIFWAIMPPKPATI